MNKDLATDTYATARNTRYGKLPERIRYEDMTEEVENAPGGANASYNAEGDWKFYSCLALDLGL